MKVQIPSLPAGATFIISEDQGPRAIVEGARKEKKEVTERERQERKKV